MGSSSAVNLPILTSPVIFLHWFPLQPLPLPVSDAAVPRDKRHRYCLTSLQHPKQRCIGFARRRVGRGGRWIAHLFPPLDVPKLNWHYELPFVMSANLGVLMSRNNDVVDAIIQFINGKRGNRQQEMEMWFGKHNSCIQLPPFCSSHCVVQIGQTTRTTMYSSEMGHILGRSHIEINLLAEVWLLSTSTPKMTCWKCIS